MRFCLVVETFTPVSAGVGNSTHALAAALAKRGHDVLVLTANIVPGSPNREIMDGFTVVRAGKIRAGGALSRFLGFAVFVGAFFWLALVRYRPHAILGQTAWSGGFLAACAGILKPSIISMTHTHGSPELCNPYYAPAKFAYRHCRRTLATNREFAASAMGWGANGPVYLSGNSLDEWNPPYGKPERASIPGYDPAFFNVVCVGRLVREHGLETKGISYALKALPGLEDTALHIYGEGELKREYQALAIELGVDSRVIFHGNVPREKLYEGMAAADALLLSSLSEGVSMTMIEGMMLGTPVISTATAGALDYIMDGKNGLLITPGSTEAIAGAIRRLRDTPGLSRALSTAAYTTYSQNFTEDAVVKSFLDAVEGNSANTLKIGRPAA